MIVVPAMDEDSGREEWVEVGTVEAGHVGRYVLSRRWICLRVQQVIVVSSCIECRF